MVATQLTLDSYLNSFTNNLNFTNQHGERYELAMINDEVGILKGDETDWRDVYLVNGFGISFNTLANDELEWLRHHFNLSPTTPELLIVKKKDGIKGYTYLDNNMCPVCLKQSSEFEIHHVVAACVGGSDAYQNKIKICASCHSLETNGESRYMYSIGNALFHLCVCNFGAEFFFCQRSGNNRYKERHIKQYGPVWEIIKYICKYQGEIYKKTGQKPALDTLLNVRNSWYKRSFLEISRLKYHYFRQVFLGTIPFNYIRQVVFDKDGSS